MINDLLRIKVAIVALACAVIALAIVVNGVMSRTAPSQRPLHVTAGEALGIMFPAYHVTREANFDGCEIWADHDRRIVFVFGLQGTGVAKSITSEGGDYGPTRHGDVATNGYTSYSFDTDGFDYDGTSYVIDLDPSVIEDRA